MESAATWPDNAAPGPGSLVDSMKHRQSRQATRRGSPFLGKRVHDPYQARGKLRSATRCPDCGVQYRNGRWVWATAESRGLKQHRCPACRRIAEHYPAGELVLAGSFMATHRKELLSIVAHVETLERTEHPLNRVMAVDSDGDEIIVSTTDLHLPHRLGHALKDAWGGTLKTHYDLDGYFTRVRWERDG